MHGRPGLRSREDMSSLLSVEGPATAFCSEGLLYTLVEFSVEDRGGMRTQFKTSFRSGFDEDAIFNKEDDA